MTYELELRAISDDPTKRPSEWVKIEIPDGEARTRGVPERYLLPATVAVWKMVRKHLFPVGS